MLGFHLQEFRNFPYVIRKPRFHSGSNSETRMNTAEIVIREMQSHSCGQMRQLLAERIREASESPHRQRAFGTPQIFRLRPVRAGIHKR